MTWVKSFPIVCLWYERGRVINAVSFVLVMSSAGRARLNCWSSVTFPLPRNVWRTIAGEQQWHQTWENPALLSQLEFYQKQLLYISRLAKKIGCQRGSSSSGAAREWVIAVPENCRKFLHTGQHPATLIREKSPFTSIGLRKNSSTESEAYQHMVLHPGKWPQLSCELNPAVFLWLRRSWCSADNKFLGSSLQQCLQSFWQNFLDEAYVKVAEDLKHLCFFCKN